jgi:5-methylcytosine-specific restriction endonuclease McrA
MSIEDYKKRISYGEPFMKKLSEVAIKDIVGVIEKIWENSCGNFYDTIESGECLKKAYANKTTIVEYNSNLDIETIIVKWSFYDEIKIDRKVWYGSKKTLTDEINRQRRLMYYFVYVSGLSTIIEVDETWAEYLYKNKEILKGWTQLKLIHYLQNKNPSVPGIADKIEPPVERNIERVRKYWKLIIKKDPTIKDIYGDIVLNDVDISIDHFIPWQYVAHDELWNLHPTTKSINSSKSNSLPSWKKYFESLGELEYRAYVMRDQYEDIAHEFNKIAPYHLNNQDIRNLLYVKGLNKNDFIERLEHVIRPVYESAQTLGFKEWVYER